MDVQILKVLKEIKTSCNATRVHLDIADDKTNELITVSLMDTDDEDENNG